MNKLFVCFALAAGLLVGSCSMAQAQSLWAHERSDSGNSTSSPKDGKTVMLSGCLDRGAGANEYSIRATTADSRELKSDSVNLGGYLQKTVMVVAVDSGDPQAPLNVISLRFLSNACETWY